MSISRLSNLFRSTLLLSHVEYRLNAIIFFFSERKTREFYVINSKRGSAEGNVVILIVSRYRFNISNRFRSDRREFASGCDTYATRYEIRKKRGRRKSGGEDIKRV